ncbi:unnamed protein product, partial [Effrenium voratum]
WLQPASHSHQTVHQVPSQDRRMGATQSENRMQQSPRGGEGSPESEGFAAVGREEIGAWPAPDPQKDHTKAVGQPPSRGRRPAEGSSPNLRQPISPRSTATRTRATRRRSSRPAEGSSPNLRQPISPRSTATRTRRCQLQQPRRWRRQRRNHHRRLFASLALPWTSARRKARARRRRGGEGGPCCLLGV